MSAHMYLLSTALHYSASTAVVASPCPAPAAEESWSEEMSSSHQLCWNNPQERKRISELDKQEMPQDW